MKYKVGDEVEHIPSGIIREITKDREYLINKFSGDSNYKLVSKRLTAEETAALLESLKR